MMSNVSSTVILRGRIPNVLMVSFVMTSLLLLMQWNLGKFSVNVPAGKSRVDGVVVSMNPKRFNHTQHTLHKLGLNVVQKIPLPFQSREVNQSITSFLGPKHQIDKNLKLWSNQMAFVDAMKEFILEAQSTPKRWRFFFEDDVSLHPDLSPEQASSLISRGLEVADEEGFVYLGICGPTCDEKRVDLGGSVEEKMCYGMCAHGFGFQVPRLEAFLRWYERGEVTREVCIDCSMRRYGRDVKKMWVIGSNLKSPAHGGHYGVLYQDRILFPTTIGL